MKKALIALSLLVMAFGAVSAQTTINGSAAGTINGTPIKVNTGANGFGISIGTGANGATIGNTGQINGNALLGLLALAQTIVIRLVPFMIGLAIVIFFWFLIVYITKGDAPEKQREGLKGMGYSLLAIFVMVSVWGIINFASSLTGIGHGGGGDEFTPILPGQTR